MFFGYCFISLVRINFVILSPHQALGEAGRENVRKNRLEAGERLVRGACRHCSGIPAAGIPSDWSILTVYFNTYVNHFTSRGQNK